VSGLGAALDYLPRFLAHQARLLDWPGFALAVAHHGEVVLEHAEGVADRGTGEAFTPRHRFRIASHSKTITAAGIMLLREQGRLTLDDPAGKHVAGLHKEVAAIPLALLLSHGGGLIRNGRDGGYFSDLRPYPDAAELMAELAEPPVIAPQTRLKYSNIGTALLGQVIEAVTGEDFAAWMAREIIARFGLTETTPDAPVPEGVPFARGHTGRHPLGERLVIPGDNPARALAAAGGFVSTAADCARFFSALSPEARESPLSAASRRAMVHRQWRNPHAPAELWYGLGTMSGMVAGAPWFGHSGSLQGYASRTAVLPEQGLCVSLLVNAVAQPTDFLVDGLLAVLLAATRRGAPAPGLAEWQGRWWNLFGVLDLLPLGDRVLVAVPGFFNPVGDAGEIAVEGPDEGRVVLANGFGNVGERVRLVRDGAGAVVGLDFAGSRMEPEAVHAAGLSARYGRG
jgi:CubicO group peptidase (beta-lactamase class C family)